MSSRQHIAHLHLHGDLTEERYAHVLDLLAGITPTVHAVPPDAVQCDLIGAVRFFGKDAFAILQMARMRIAAHIDNIQTSAGLGPNRMIAAMAAAAAPPGQAVHVAGGPEKATLWLRPRPIAALPGVGKATFNVLDRYGVRTIGQIADLPPATLQRILAAAPARLLAERAADTTPARPPRPNPAGADNSSAQITVLIACLPSPGHERHHDLSCCYAWPTSPRPTPSRSGAC
ncbi:hypothetical protein OG900_06275 [Streptomyces sp. NBC_00433]